MAKTITVGKVLELLYWPEGNINRSSCWQLARKDRQPFKFPHPNKVRKLFRICNIKGFAGTRRENLMYIFMTSGTKRQTREDFLEELEIEMHIH